MTKLHLNTKFKRAYPLSVAIDSIFLLALHWADDANIKLSQKDIIELITLNYKKMEHPGKLFSNIKKDIYNYKKSMSADMELPTELDDFKEVLLQAARSGKYQPNNWLLPEGSKQDKRNQYRSIHHHLLDAEMGVLQDPDSGLDPRLHAACRLMMDYTRDKRGIKHPIDGKKAIHNDVKVVSHSTPWIQNYQDKVDNTSGNETRNVKYFSGDKEVTKDEFYLKFSFDKQKPE